MLSVSSTLALGDGATLDVTGGTLVVQGSISLSGALTETGADLYDNAGAELQITGPPERKHFFL